MSKTVLRDVLCRMDGSAVLIDRHQQSWAVSSLQQLAEQGSVPREQERATLERQREDLALAYGYNNPSREKVFAFEDGVAIIPVHGMLINRYNGSWGYVTGYNFIRAQLNAALDDDDVKLIVLDVNSYGGEAAGCFELCDEIREARDRKSILSVVDSNACSAAYAIGSSAGKMYVTPSGQAGSIGVIAMHVNMQKMLEQWGIEITLIIGGDHKADGNPYEKLPESVRKDFQASVDKRTGEFIELVSKNRGLDSEAVRATQAQTYRADEALKLGLIDAVKTPTEAVATFLAELGFDDPNEDEEQDMSATAKPGDQAAADQAAADARTAERTRIQGITNHASVHDGNRELANHLAYETDTSVELAGVMLGKIAKPEAAAAPAPKGDEKAGKTKPGAEAAGKGAFEEAMDKADHPEVGEDEKAGKGGEQNAGRGKRAMSLAGFGGKQRADSGGMRRVN